ncbi:MAG TPA: substrate-binding domain-containing protein, partial [Polyangiaceae bacterium]|nr:substrate-binding domain-containing protein [Polyangiaceae bacterium]
MKRRRTTVALLFDSLVSEYTVSLRRAVERAATANDVSVLVVMGQAVADPVAAAVTQNQIYELIGAKRVDGVIVCSATVGHYCGTNGLVEFCRAYAPLPVCSIGVDLPGIPSVIIDNEGGMRLGVEHLIDVHDARRLVFIGGPEASVESNLRLAGYQKALEGRGLPFERELVVHGGFTVPTGAAAMRAVLDAGVAFDAVVAANDDMALGALDVLKQAGLNVPRDIPIFGFDDIDSAHYARPPLSTLRQPLWWLGERAIQNILGQLRGEQVPALSIGPVDFVRRESCGCGYQVNATDHPQGDEWPNLREVLRSRRDALAVALRAAASTPNAALGDWPSLLLDALAHDLGGAEGHFSAVFEDLLERAQREGASLDEFQRVVSVLRSELRRARVRDEDGPRRLEHIWHNARVLVGAASIRFLGRQKLEQQYATSGLSLVGERLATTLSLPLLRDELVDGLPR